MLSENTQSFLYKRIAFENLLNTSLYMGEFPTGELCSHAVNRWYRGQPVISLSIFIRTLLWLLFQMIKPNVLVGKRYVYLMPNRHERTERIFKPLKDVSNSDLSLFITVNNFYRGYPVSAILKWLTSMPLSFVRFYQILQKALRTDSDLLKRSTWPLVLVWIIQTLKLQVALNKFSTNKIDSVVVDLDRSSLAAPIILAARSARISNSTLVHGSVLPPYLYVPIIADKVFCWGEFHERLFRTFANREVKYHISGCTVPQVIYQRTSQKSGRTRLTFVSQNFGSNVQYDAIVELASISNELKRNGVIISVKAHPADNYTRLKRFCEERGVDLFGPEISLEDCFNQTDLFVIMSSAFAFDAVGSGVPVVFFIPDDTQRELADMFHREAEALLATNAVELLNLLLDRELRSRNYNLNKLNDFLTKYLVRSGHEAAKVIISEIEG